MTVLLKAKEEADKHTSQSKNQIWHPADELIPNTNLQCDPNDRINWAHLEYYRNLLLKGMKVAAMHIGANLETSNKP